MTFPLSPRDQGKTGLGPSCPQFGLSPLHRPSESSSLFLLGPALAGAPQVETGRTGLNHPSRMESFGHRMLSRGSGQVENRTQTETPRCQSARTFLPVLFTPFLSASTLKALLCPAPLQLWRGELGSWFPAANQFHTTPSQELPAHHSQPPGFHTPSQQPPTHHTPSEKMHPAYTTQGPTLFLTPHPARPFRVSDPSPRRPYVLSTAQSRTSSLTACQTDGVVREEIF